jgi:hypothetical protein
MTAIKAAALSPIRDDSAAHQIRIEYTSDWNLCVSCTCVQRQAPGGYLSRIRDAVEAIDIWRRHWVTSLAAVNPTIRLPHIS